MVTGDTRRIVVIKDISSNLIEEAILILKSDPVSGGTDEQPVILDTSRGRVRDRSRDRNRVKNDFILKEAEALINNYLRENRLQKLPDRRGKRIKFPQRRAIISFIINLLLVGSIALLIFMAGRLF